MTPEQLRLYCAPCCRYLPAAQLAARNASDRFVCMHVCTVHEPSVPARRKRRPGTKRRIRTVGTWIAWPRYPLPSPSVPYRRSNLGQFRLDSWGFIRAPLLRGIHQTLHVGDLAVAHPVQFTFFVNFQAQPFGQSTGRAWARIEAAVWFGEQQSGGERSVKG